MSALDARAFSDRLADARDLQAIGQAAGDACTQASSFGIFNYVALGPVVTEHPTMIVRSDQFSPEWGQRHFTLLLLAFERELGGLAGILGGRRAYDVLGRYPLQELERTELFNDHLRPAGSHHQLVAPLWRDGAPLGYFAVSRPRAARPFGPEDLRAVEEIRIMTERRSASLLDLGAGDLAATLEFLSLEFPHPAFLFGDDGRLRWMSAEGGLRLGVAAARFGAGRLVQGNAAFEALSGLGGALAGGRTTEAAAELQLRGTGTLRDGERLSLRRFTEGGRALLLLALVPAMVNLGGETAAPDGDGARIPGLGAVESRVAWLAAGGYTILNIAARLGVAETTARTHLRRVYVKLGVHGRAELASALLTQRR